MLTFQLASHDESGTTAKLGHYQSRAHSKDAITVTALGGLMI
ncbi:uncharacterized, partial [Tachysurus ichikawai]